MSSEIPSLDCATFRTFQFAPPSVVSSNVDSKSIKQKAQQKGMHTLRADGAKKVLQGITSVAEVLRATEEEGVVAQV